MTRALETLFASIHSLRAYPGWVLRNPRRWASRLPRVGYCDCCGVWAWRTNETPAYSCSDGAFLCEECADINDEETRHAWADYYGSIM